MPRTGLALCCLWIASCGHAPLDRNVHHGSFSTGTSVKDVPVRGFHVEVTTEQMSYQGELLAVSKEHLYLLVNEARPQAMAIRRADVREVEVRVQPSSAAGTGALTAIGTVSTISHGVLLIITAPMWLISGISATAEESAASTAVAEGDTMIDRLAQYARWPQGLLGATGAARTSPAPPTAGTPAPHATPSTAPMPTEAALMPQTPAPAASDAGTQPPAPGPVSPAIPSLPF